MRKRNSLNHLVPEEEVVAFQDAELRIHLYAPSTIIGVEEFTTTIEGACHTHTCNV
jgi:hypothetical protein